MATLTYTPGEGVSTDLPRPGELLASFLLAPVATVVGGLVAGATQFVRGLFGRDRDRPVVDFAVTADSETGLLTAPRVTQVLTVPKLFAPTQGILAPPPERIELGRTGRIVATKILDTLQRTFDTGVIQPGVPENFRRYAEALVQFRKDIDASKLPPEPEEPEEPDDLGPEEPLEPEEPEAPEEPEEPEEPEDVLREGDQPFLPFPDFSPNILTDIPSLSPPGVEGFFMPSFARGIPGGSAGFNQQTTAGKMLLLGRGRAMPGRGRRRRRRRPIKTPPRATAKRASGGARSSKFNSAAWMAKIRKLRGKKKRKVK